MRVPAPVLRVEGLVAGWDASSVVVDACVTVAPTELVAVLGGNGSGKSCLLWAVAGLLRPRAGRVLLGDRRIDRLPAERVAALGLRLLPQARRVFGSLTVRENMEAVEIGLARLDLAETRRRRAGWLARFPVLADKVDQPAATLSGGEQQLLAIGRAVSAAPRVLLLDEPSAGLSPARAAECAAVFVELAASGVAVLLVEQNVPLARRVATRVLHMRGGRLNPDDS